MWDNNGAKSIIRNVLIILVIVILLTGLFFAMLRIRESSRLRDQELSELYAQQKQVQNEARQESTVSIQMEYDKDMETVQQYLPGIVCWGDNTTAASSGSMNYPYVLQTYINTYLCDIYDFSSTIENAAELPRFNWDEYSVKIPVVNMGAGKESSYTVLGRAGAIPYVTSTDMVIPAASQPVSISFTSEGGQVVTPLTGGDAGINPVTINGVEGVLSINSEDYNYNGTLHYYFTRSVPGGEVSVPAGTIIKTAASDLYRNYIHVIFIGVYGEYVGADDLVHQVRSFLARQTQNADRFIVLGPYINNQYSFSTYQLDAIDTAMMQAFGSRYISVRKYLVGDGYADAGISPTGEDVYYINQNIVPPSFKVASHSEELNSRAHRLLGKLVFGRMQSLGYFDEVSTELNLEDTTKKILKETPDYFESIIQNILK